MKDEPYTISTIGRLVVGNQKDRTLKAVTRKSTIVAGLFLDDIIGENIPNFELWDVEVEIKVRRKHRGSPCQGGTIDTQLCSALNEPDRWLEKTFDSLEDK